MRPFKILLFILIVFLVLLFISIVFPKDGIHIGNKLLLRFPDFQSLNISEDPKYVDISELLKYHQSNITENTNSIFPDTLAETPDSLFFVADSLKAEIKTDTLFLLDSTTFIKEKNKPGTIKQQIEYSTAEKNDLYPFFKHLGNLKKTGDLIRVLHYGDSQIEGDRISSFIRNELQKEFGGSGIGLFPAVIIKGTTISLEQKLNGDWERYTMQSIKNGTIYHKRLGALMSFSRFAPIFHENNEVYSGEINLRKSNNSYLNTRKFKHCKVFYGYNEKPFIAELKYKDKTIDAEIIPVSQQLKTISWKIDNAIDEITISFKGEDSPNIYAIALDDFKGIAVDNIPLRGSSGTDFTRTDLAFFRSMYQKLNVKLVLMQFGVNLVPHIVNDYSYYEKQLEKQLKTIKSLRPDICIIVIGVSDMSRNENGNYVSYPNIEKIRAAQKNAAFNAGCAFWDTYEAMGGKNSMPLWVNNDPPLARTDFTHFSWKGSTIIAKMFYDALMFDFKIYQNAINEKIEISSNEKN